MTGDLPDARSHALRRREVNALVLVHGGDNRRPLDRRRTGRVGRGVEGTTEEDETGSDTTAVAKASEGGRGRGRGRGREYDEDEDRGRRGGLRKEGSRLPFELVGQVAGTGAMAEAGNVEGGPTARRHVENCGELRLGDDNQMPLRRGEVESDLSR